MKFIIAVVAFVLLSGICSAELGYFWHFSDTHMQSDYYEGSDPKKGCYEGKGNAGKFGDYNCRSPYPVEVTLMNDIPTLRPEECPNKDPLFVLWTGDSVAMRHGKYSEDVIKFDLKNLTHLFQKLHGQLGGRVPIFPVIGNHDAYPQHQLPPSDYWVYDTVAELWGQFLPKTAVETLKKHGYYSVKVTKELRLIVLNTVLYYVNNKRCTGIKDPAGQIAWMRKELEEAKKAGEVVYIAGHIPVRGTGGCFHTEFEKPFLEGMKGYHHIIMGSFWGHCHTDAFQLFGNYTSGDYHVGHLAANVGSAGNRNPSYRRYIFDTSKKYAIQDWRTFYMDLEAANKAKKIKWATLYDAKTQYGIIDATPQSMLALTHKIRDNSDIANKYYHNRHGGYPGGHCDQTCQKRLACTILHATTSAYEKCMK